MISGLRDSREALLVKIYRKQYSHLGFWELRNLTLSTIRGNLTSVSLVPCQEEPEVAPTPTCEIETPTPTTCREEPEVLSVCTQTETEVSLPSAEVTLGAEVSDLEETCPDITCVNPDAELPDSSEDCIIKGEEISTQGINVESSQGEITTVCMASVWSSVRLLATLLFLTLSTLVFLSNFLYTLSPTFSRGNVSCVPVESTVVSRILSETYFDFGAYTDMSRLRLLTDAIS